MSKILKIHPHVFSKLPNLRVVAVHGKNLRAEPEQLEIIHNFFLQAWRLEHSNKASWTKNLEYWKETQKSLKIPNNKLPSILSLKKRVSKWAEPAFVPPPLAAFYLAVGLKYTTCLGGMNANCLPIELRFTQKGDFFQEKGTTEEKLVRSGELSYCQENRCLSRYFTWKQGEPSGLQDHTTEMLFVAEILDKMPDVLASSIQNDLVNGVEQLFNGQATSSILSRENLEWNVEDDKYDRNRQLPPDPLEIVTGSTGGNSMKRLERVDGLEHLSQENLEYLYTKKKNVSRA